METKVFLKRSFICIFLFASFLVYSQENCQLPWTLKYKLQTVLNAEAESLGVNGISAALSLPDNKIITITSGYSYENIPIDPQMLMGVGSITKNFISAIILQLVEEKKLKLSDPIYKYFPDHNNIDRNITIKELLSHTSGIFDYTTNEAFFGDVLGDPTKIWTTEEIFNFVLPSVFEHGTSWGYSNTNFVILGCIIRKITKHDVSFELDKRIFRPVHLTSTFLYPEEPYKGELAHVWFDSTDFTEAIGTSLSSCAWTAGGLLSTPSDLVKWSKALYGGKVIKKASLQKMMEPSVQNPNYGLGTMLLDVNGQTTYGHYGDILYNSYLNYFPDDKLSIAVCGNKANILMEGTMLALYTAYKDYKPDNIIKAIEIASYPNPFASSVTFSYELYKNSKVTLKISSVFGKEVVVLKNGNELSGLHTIQWNGADSYGKPVNSGTYVYTFIIDGKAYGGIVVKK
jgi:D-alanyl-D-alanine carboxypeptidase